MSATHTASRRINAAIDPSLPNAPASDLDTFRALLDARVFSAVAGAGTYEGVRRTVVSGNAAAPSLAPGDIESIVATDSTGATWALQSINPAAVLPGALTASTIHYLYAGVTTGGALTLTVSTSPPTFGNYLVTGGENRRLVATFATGLLGFPLPAVVGPRSGRYVTSSGRAELVARAPGPVVGGTGGVGRETAWTSVDLSKLVPPWATSAWIMAKVVRAAADPAVVLRVRRSSADGGSLTVATARNLGASDSSDEGLVQVPLLGQGFEYQLSADVTDDPAYGATFLVAGWG